MVKLTKAITHSVGADWSFLDFPILIQPRGAGHSIRRAVTPQIGNQPSVVMRSAKRWKNCATARHRRRPTRRAWADGALPRKAAEGLPGRCRLGMNLDVEGSGQHEAVGVRFPCTPGHDGGNQDEGLQRPACPVAATVLLGGVFDLFPDLRSDKLTHRTGERLGTLWRGVVPVSLMPAPREPNTVQPWDRPCLHGGLA